MQRSLIDDSLGYTTTFLRPPMAPMTEEGAERSAV
jgi:hypothetical protein